MSELSKDFLATLTQRALDAGVLPQALEDLWYRVELDEPVDIGGYIGRLRETSPHLFGQSPAPETPAHTTILPQAAQDYNKLFLKNLETIAGPDEARKPRPTPPPAIVARGDQAAFLENVERIATGQCKVE